MNTVTLQNTSSAELNAMVGEMLKSEDVSQVAVGKPVMGEDGVQTTALTVTLANGKVVNVTVATPDLDGATDASYDAADYAALSNAVSSLADDMSGIGATGGASALGDLYAVLDLLYKAAQKQRETALQARAAEHAMTQASLETQASEAIQTAEESYAAAHSAAIAQIVTSSISCVAAGVSLGMQIGSANAGGVKSARADYNAAKKDLAQVKAWPENGANNNVKVADTPVTNVKTPLNKLDQPDVNVDEGPTTQSLKTSQAACVQAQGNVDQKQTAYTNADTKVQADKTKVAQLEAEVKAHPNDAAAQQKLVAAKTELDADLKVRDDAKVDLDKAKIDCGQKAQAYGKQLDRVMDRANADPNLFDGEREELKNFCDGQKAALRDDAIRGASTRLESAGNAYDNAIRREMNSKWMLASKGMDLTAQVSKMAGDTTANAYNAKAQYVTGMGQASQKIREAEQEGHKAQIESTSELAQAELDLLKFINQMLQNITQAESNAVQSAIRA